MRTVFDAVLTSLVQGQAVVRTSVMKSNGSTPRGAGAGMAVFGDGSIVGTIGGGAVESASISAALQVLESGKSEIREFDLSAKDAATLGMVCGGEMTVFLDLMEPCSEQITLVKDILQQYAKREQNVYATILDSESNVTHRGMLTQLRECLPDNQELDLPRHPRAPFVRSFDGGTLFAEPLTVAETVYFVGAGHVAQATAPLAAFTGFRVSVTDDREEFANGVRYPDAQEVNVVKELKDCLPSSLGINDYVVIMTRGHLHDREVLAQALKTRAGYVGMIGSKKKRAAVYNSLLNSGFTQEDLTRVHCPIGVPIGADSPEEIAVSIMAELIAFRAQFL
jgi:xanthine dehydrogenase accessory factor